VHFTRGFVPWRLSDDGPGASRTVSMGRHPKPSTNLRLHGGQSMSALQTSICSAIAKASSSMPRYRTFDLGMPKQELDGPQVARP